MAFKEGHRAFRAQLAASPLAPLALRAAGASVGLLASLAIAGAGVRVLPWLLDEAVSFSVALPFARAVASVALEAAVLVGWPVGWALAAFTLAERGEARVLELLGERPERTVLRLLPMAMLFGAVLGGVSLAGGRDASEPGRVVQDLLAQGRATCASAVKPRVIDVPLVGLTWLCEAHGEHAEPRVVGAPPGAGDAMYSAAEVEVAPDARRVWLRDAWLTLAKPDRHDPEGAARLRVHVARVVLDLPPFVRASALAPAWRAVLLATSAAAAALLAAWSVLVLAARPEGVEKMWRLHALALGAAGPVGTLGLLHALERANAPAWAFASLFPASVALTAVVAGLAWSLLRWRAAASK
jgi:hypothetical protein